MNTANTEPVPTFTRARRQLYAASMGVLIGVILYAQAVAMGALR